MSVRAAPLEGGCAAEQAEPRRSDDAAWTVSPHNPRRTRSGDGIAAFPTNGTPGAALAGHISQAWPLALPVLFYDLAIA